MKHTYIVLTIAMLFASLCMNAQSIQYGYTEEYKGANEKTPLKGVNIMAGGATTKSDKTGKFRLDFTTLKVGDKVDVDLRSVANLKGYVLFNKEAVEQWTVSGKSVYFRIVLCKQKDFDAMVKNYYNVSDKAYKEKLQKERDRADKLKKEGEIQQQEYERLLKEAEERYNQAFKNLKENAELVARIDESELEGNQAQILQLAKEGRLDEAVELIRQSNTDELLENAAKKRAYAEEQKTFYEQKEAEAKAEISKLIARLKNEIKILKLAGGKESYDLCGEKWRIIAEADTTNLTDLFSAAVFFENQNSFETSERYYLIVERGLAKKMQSNPESYLFKYASVLNSLAVLNAKATQYSKAEPYYLKSLDLRKRLAEKNPDENNDEYASLLSNIGALYHKMEQYDKTLEYYLQAAEIRKALVEKEPNDGNQDSYSQSLQNIGALYKDIEQYEKSEGSYQQALAILRVLVKKDPDSYNDSYATTLGNIGNLYYETQQYDSTLVCYTEAEQIYSVLAKKNPDAYNLSYAWSLISLGNIDFKGGWYDKSQECFVKASSIFRSLFGKDPRIPTSKFVEILAGTANQAIFNKDYVVVEQFSRECLTIDPSHVASKILLMYSLLFRGRYDDAEKIALEIKDIETGDSTIGGLVVRNLAILERRGIIPEEYKADVERIKSVLTQK